MKNIQMRPYLLLLTIVVTTLFVSCDPCDNLDCAASNFHGQFRIVSASNGQDLVFGPNKIYDKQQIRFYSLNGTDTTFFVYKTIEFGGVGYDSILYVHFYPGLPNVAYMRLSNSDIDTLHITYDSTDTKCCGRITTITNFRFNNSVDIPGTQGTQEIKK